MGISVIGKWDDVTSTEVLTMWQAVRELFAQQAEAIVTMANERLPFRVVEYDLDDRFQFALLVLGFERYSVKFATDMDGYVLVDFAAPASPNYWVNSSSVTDVLSEGTSGLHRIDLSTAFRAVQEFLGRKDIELAGLFAPETAEQARGDLERSGIRSFERSMGTTVGSITRKSRGKSS